MTKAKLVPFINRFTGDIRVMTKQQGKELLNEDWAQPRVVTNSEGEKVFRFELSAEVTGRDGKVHMGTATVDLTENEPEEVEPDGNGNPKEIHS